MSTGTQQSIDFCENLSGMITLPPQVTQPHLMSAFRAASEPGLHSDLDLKPSEPAVQEQPALDTLARQRLADTVMGSGLSFQAPQGMKTQESDLATLGKGVAGTAMEAGMALFNALGNKREEPDLDVAEVTPVGPQANMHFRPRTSSPGGLF